MPKKNIPNLSHQAGSGFFSELILKIRLGIKLMQDARVKIWLKAIPIFCLIYFIFPIDLLIGPIDDLVILYFGIDLFIQLCPQDLVREYKEEMTGSSSKQTDSTVIDGHFKDD